MHRPKPTPSAAPLSHTSAPHRPPRISHLSLRTTRRVLTAGTLLRVPCPPCTASFCPSHTINTASSYNSSSSSKSLHSSVTSSSRRLSFSAHLAAPLSAGLLRSRRAAALFKSRRPQMACTSTTASAAADDATLGRPRSGYHSTAAAAASTSQGMGSSASMDSSTWLRSLSAISNNTRRHCRRRHGALCVCQAKKARGGGGGTGTRQRKKPPSNKVTIGTNVRQAVVEELLKEDGKTSSNNIVPAGPLSKSSRHHRALVLDSAYRPINVWTWPKAVMMDVLQRCDVIDYYPPPAHAFSGRGLHKLPAVVRVDTYVDISGLVQQVSCTPRNIMLRDKFCCQYCGSKHQLTLDHMVPISKGGKSTWTNLITACQSCNQKKGDKLISQLGWKLQGPPPREPKPHEVGFVAGLRLKDLIRPPEVWSLFLEPYRARMGSLLEEMAVVKEELNLDDD